MSGSLWIPSTDVSGDQATIAANKRWQSRLFTSSGTWVVPADVGVIWVDGCGGGAGGSGGYAGVGGGGAGGGAAAGVIYGRFPVAPGETLTLTIGAGGTGGAIGATGNNYTAGASQIKGSLEDWVFQRGFSLQTAATVSAGSTIPASTSYSSTTVFTDSGSTNMNAVTSGVGGQYHITQPGAGGAPGVAGGLSSIPPLKANHLSGLPYTPGGVFNGSGGGGGAGGNGPFGHSGRGGDGGANGSNATGYGAGGGGGGSNGAGGNGSPGMIRIYCFSATTI